MTIYFQIIDCKSLYNVILVRDWMIPMGEITLTRYQYVKFPHQWRIAEIHSNQWGAHAAYKKQLKDIKASNVKGWRILETTYPEDKGREWKYGRINYEQGDTKWQRESKTLHDYIA